MPNQTLADIQTLEAAIEKLQEIFEKFFKYLNIIDNFLFQMQKDCWKIWETVVFRSWFSQTSYPFQSSEKILSNVREGHV